MKNRLFGLGVTVLAMVSLDIAMAFFSIPIAAMDIIVCSLALALVAWGIIAMFRSKKQSRLPKIEPLPLRKRFGLIVFNILMVAMGAVLMWLGFQEPLKLFTGVKGAVHGYSAVCLGALILGFSCFVLFRLTLGYPKDLDGRRS